MYGESDSDSYAPSWAGSDYTPPVARSRRRKQNQKMLVEVVIPIPNSSKRKASSPAWSPRNPSPTRSESSISLGTNWHRSPRKKRRRQRKRTDTVIEESTQPRRRPGRPRKQVADGPTPSVHFQASQSAAESTATSRPRPSTITVDLASARLDNIQAQERSRGYQHLFTPPSSGDTRSPDLKERVARGSPLSRTGSRLYALDAGQAGSSTGPGTQEWAKARGTANEFPSSQRETRSSTLAASSQVPGYRSAYSQPRDMSATPKQEHTTAGSPVKGQDLGRLPQVAFADPDYDLWAQIGLRVTFERMVEEYGFSMDMVQKVYDSRGSVEDTEQFLIKMKNMMTDAMHNPEIYKSSIAGPLDHVTSDVAKAFVFIYAPRLAAALLDHDASAYNSEPVPVLSIPRSIDRDPLFIAKRKILLSKEGALDTSHSAIKKNVPWSDLSKGIEDGPPNKRVRLSQSTSITPGIPEILKDTPTPASQSSIHSAIKASRSIKGFGSIKPSRPSLTVVSPGGSRGKPRHSQSAPRVTIRSPPSARKAQTQPPEVIDLVSASEEAPPERHPSAVSASAVDDNHNDELGATAGQSLPRPSSPPPISNSEAYDVGSHQGQDVYDPNEWLNRHTSPARAATLPPRSTATQTPSRAPSFASYLNDFARPEQSVPRSTPIIESTQSTAPSKASRKRKRETSEMGIQTLRADQVDWLEGLEIDDSMTDIDVSRVWVEHVSPKKRRAEDVLPNGDLEDHEEEEAPIGNFLDRLKEEGLAGRDEEQEWEQEQESHVEVPGNQEEHVEEHYEGGNEQSLEQALETDDAPNHPNESENVEAQDEPVVISTVSKPASTSPLKPEPRRISTSQPVANAFAPRSGSRLYTPQPEPTFKHRQDLRAAPTLGRSLLGDNVQPQPIPARVALGAAPTLGRSAEFSPELLKSSKSKGKSAQARSPRHPSARSSSAAVADHDVEHVSAPDVPVNPPGTTSKQPAPRGHTPILISSSPTHRNWELEPTRTSTPQRFQTRMSPSVSEPVHDEALEDEPIPSTGKHRPSLVPLPTSTPSLAALDKRRRSSLAPLSRQSSLGAKKIRRDYDTTGSSAAPRVRAHKDTYDEFGDRIWVPSRPKMKRASDEAIAKFANDDSRIISHEIEQEDTREEEEEQDHNEQDRTRAKATPAFTTTSTEIPETPQVPRSHNLFDMSSELRGTSGVRMQSSPAPAPPVVAEAPQPAAMAVEPRVDPAPVPIVVAVPVVPVSASPSPARPRPTASPSPSPSQPAVEFSPPEANAARVTPITTARDATLPLSSPVVKLDNKSYQQQPSKLRPQRHSLQTTPALRPVWSSARTRLSIGPAGFTLLHASGYDKDELAKAGLEPMMQRLADKHGFNVNLVASLFQETGSLKETEESLARMQRSVEKTRAEIRRESFRKVGVDLLHGEEIPLDSSPNGDGADAEDGEDFRDWDTSRTRSRLLFGD